MPPKRPLSTYAANDDSKRPRNESPSAPEDKAEKLRRARQRIQELKAAKEAKKKAETATSGKVVESETSTKKPTKPERIGRGLQAELHPLFTGKASSTPVQPDNPNLQKVNKRGFAVNPYLTGVTQSRPKREFSFVEKGHYVSQANEIRIQKEVAEKKRRLEEMRRKAGLEPDLSIGEDKYRLEIPPVVEWWDVPFLKDGDYDQIDESAISMYLQHHERIEAPMERHMPEVKPLYMTKKEMKRKRKNERAERYQEQQDRIKLGLEPPPPPKVKLSNMMNVLTNEALLDPTGTEMKVRAEIAKRKEEHENVNRERKLTKEERHEKLEKKQEKDIQKGYHSAVFAIAQLEHPQHRFKVDQNAQQLKLVGTALYGESLVLVVVEGSEKSVNAYKKLMLNRIKWTEGTVVNGEPVDLSRNKCMLVWEGQLREFHFKKWGVFHATGDQGALDYLEHFGVQSYYREALAQMKAT